MSHKLYTEAPECLVSASLALFKLGQTLCFKLTIRPDYHGHLVGEFVKVDKGLVHVKAVGIIDPSWYNWHEFDRKYPGRIVRLRPKSCYLWGRFPDDKLTHNYCHWFKDAKTPVD